MKNGYYLTKADFLCVVPSQQKKREKSYNNTFMQNSFSP